MSKLGPVNQHTLKLNNVSMNYLVIPVEGQVTRNLLKYLENTGLTKTITRVGGKKAPLQTRHIARRFLGHALLTLGNRKNFLPLGA